MSYGIDRQLRDTQDSITSGTRKPLDNRLLDVLALQKIKEAQVQAKTELEASMPQSQGTIADQLTKSVIDAEKERMQGGIAEKAAQVGQVGQQQAQQQQQNMQRMAKGIPTQPAPNMARMAGGGIVTFAEGDKVKALSSRTPTQLLAEVGITEAEFARMSDQEKAAVFETISRNRRLAREVGTGTGSANEILAGIYDLSSIPVTIAGKAIGTAGKAMGLMNPQSPDPLQHRTPEGEHTWTPALDALDRMAQRNQPITRQDLAPRDTKLAGSLGPDLAALSGIVGAPGGQSAVKPPAPDAQPPAPVVKPPAPAVPQITMDPADIGNQDKLGIAGQVKYSRQPEMAGVIQKQNELREYLKGVRGQDVGAAREAQLARADKHMNRAGIAKQYQDMLARRQEADRVSKQEREYWALNDMLARAGGRGALSNIARGAADIRAANRAEDYDRFSAAEKLEREGIKTDTNIADRTLASGDKAAELTSNEKRAAATAESNLLANQASSLTEEAKAVLRGDIANLSEKSRSFDRKLALMTANANNATKIAVANLNGRLKSEANAIAKAAVEAKSEAARATVLARIADSLGTITAGVSTDLQKHLSNDPTYMALQKDDPKKAEVYKKNIQAMYNGIATDAVRELKELRKTLLSQKFAGYSLK